MTLCAQRCPTLSRPQGWQPAWLLYPWKSPGKNTGVGCHFLLQGIFFAIAPATWKAQNDVAYNLEYT